MIECAGAPGQTQWRALSRVQEESHVSMVAYVSCRNACDATTQAMGFTCSKEPRSSLGLATYLRVLCSTVFCCVTTALPMVVGLSSAVQSSRFSSGPRYTYCRSLPVM